MISRDQEHRDWLVEVSTGDDSAITPDIASLAEKAWDVLWKASRKEMPVPAARTGPDGQMFYAWDQGRHHLELEIIPGQQEAEFFYKDRETGEYWGEDYIVGDSLPERVVAVIGLFVDVEK